MKFRDEGKFNFVVSALPFHLRSQVTRLQEGDRHEVRREAECQRISFYECWDIALAKSQLYCVSNISAVVKLYNTKI